ncbi:hypothetical protein B0T19DRAFT_188711 [Cercophora scortea]|uniref:Uncharacterized protein n=1 Tax=Cercophora scortea TaxID=314031 RepID=A0AAE0IP50_9PEZI|nr:hypothetical protein B0T19DRAFT_188711 [Cercophora scortea]
MLVKLQSHRLLGRPKSILAATVVIILLYWLLLKTESLNPVHLPHIVADLTSSPATTTLGSKTTRLSGEPSSTKTTSLNNAHETAHVQVQDGQSPDTVKDDHPKPPPPPSFKDEAAAVLSEPGAGAIYGNTLETLIEKDNRPPAHKDAIGQAADKTSFSNDRPHIFNPYPKYDSPAWKSSHAEYVPCSGPAGAAVQDIRVFKGWPRSFPDPGFGGYGLLGLDQNLCYERETRLSQYGLSPDSTPATDGGDQLTNSEDVNWGELQDQCVEKNRKRFAPAHPQDDSLRNQRKLGASSRARRAAARIESRNNATAIIKEPRTALLLRSYTGKKYTENDKQIIRSLITELNLRTGGEYQVFLLVQVKGPEDIWSDDKVYESIIESEIPKEFRGITILWNEESVKAMYPLLDENARKVHNSQFVCVQMFMQTNREFDYVWNWEMDSRSVGHHYDLLTKLAEFSKKQPRRGLWERNERFYIPSLYGDYDTDFRAAVAQIYGKNTVWGPPGIPGVDPIGPKPPVSTPEEDNYEWGVGEDADLITVSPIFNPNNSDWVLRNQVWGYSFKEFVGADIPRRATIITQSRISRKLIDTMHAETLRGNHVASEMVAQTVALLHGLKAVYAPMPVFFDRPWKGTQLARWFNGGPLGESGNFGSAMGWGREGRFQGSTWYFRAIPPQRLYNNWMGYEDTGIGGSEWESKHGRLCLPAMLLHPIKDVRPTAPGESSDSKLPYG